MTRHDDKLVGDEEQLFRDLHPPLLRRLTGALGGDHHTAEDACARTWAIFLRRQPRRSPTLSGWLWTTAWHEALAQRHGESRNDPSAFAEASHEPDVLDRVLDAEHVGQVLRRIASLPPSQRSALVLLAAGLTYAEIGSATGCSYRQVNRYLVKGRARLRQVAPG